MELNTMELSMDELAMVNGGYESDNPDDLVTTVLLCTLGGPFGQVYVLADYIALKLGERAAEESNKRLGY